MKRLYLMLLLFALVGMASAQQRTVSGKVTNVAGDPLAGVAVIVVEDQTNGTITGMDGSYSLRVGAASKQLEFSFIGMQTKVFAISGSVLNVVMEEAAELVDEVLVVAYGTTKKSSFTGSASQVAGEDLVNKPVVSVGEAMAGLAAGVQVSSNSGQPGALSSVRIRGTGSISSSNDPLYVIDGVPTTNGNITGVGSSTSLGALSFLNPNDIESISILKDAAAAALYGSRAANGVILITTKRGQGGKTKFSVKSEVGFSDFAVNTLELATPAEAFDYKVMGYKNYLVEYSKMAEDVAQKKANEGITKYFDAYDPDRPDSDYDWIDPLFSKGATRNIEVSASGGNQKTKFFTSLSYLNTEGLAVGSDFSRFSGRLNIDHKASKLLEFGATTSLSFVEQNVIPTNGFYFANPLYATRNYLNQLTPVKTKDGMFNEDIKGGSFPNLIKDNGLNSNRNEIWTTDVQGYAQVNIIEGLTFRTTNSLGLTLIYGSKYFSPLSNDGKSFEGYAYEQNKKRMKLSTSNVLTYSKSFDDNHNTDFLLGYEAQDMSDRLLTADGKQFPNDVTSTLDVAAKPLGVNLNKDGDRIQSVFSRLNYNYANRYYASVSYRTDASSRLGANNRWGHFYSVSGSWRISSESWMENVKVLDDLKLRVSYGENGTLPTSWIGALGLYSYGYDYNNVPGIAYTQIANPDLSWEKNNTFSIALEARLLEIFNLELEFYNRKTTDLLLEVPVSRTTGFSSYWDNVGEMTNRGVEISLRSQNMKKNDFEWFTQLYLAKNKNRIDKLVGGDNVATFPFILREGESYNSIYLRDWAGVNPENGHAQWYLLEDEKRVDKDDDGKYDVTEDSRLAGKKIVGDGTPDLTGSLSNKLVFKDFDFEFLFTFQVGGDAYIDPYSFVYDDGASLSKAVTKAQLEDYWTTPGQHATLPKVVYGSPQNSHYNSSRRLIDGSYLRLRSLNLGYNIPDRWVAQAGLSTARVYVSAINLWTLSGMKHFDPEGNTRGVILSNFDFPPTKTITLGLQLHF